MKEVKTRKIAKHEYASFLRKAESFYNGMKQAEQSEDWNLACLNAIHCTITSIDAITTFFLEERSAGQKHEDVVELLKQTKLPDAQEKARQVLDILALKTMVEYEPTEPTENQARQITKQAQRVHQWAKQTLKP